MEKTFNKIVLSHTEPNIEDLWMRINIEKLPDGKAIHGHSLWWFTPQGWKKLFDFDTRYSVDTDYSYDISQIPFDSASAYDPKVGVVSVDNTYYLYDGSRTLSSSSNFVLEKGLKKHVDNLQSQINTLKERVDEAEESIINLRRGLTTETSERKTEDTVISDRLSEAVETITETLSGITATINTLASRVEELESRNS